LLFSFAFALPSKWFSRKPSGSPVKADSAACTVVQLCGCQCYVLTYR